MRMRDEDTHSTHFLQKAAPMLNETTIASSLDWPISCSFPSFLSSLYTKQHEHTRVLNERAAAEYTGTPWWSTLVGCAEGWVGGGTAVRVILPK